MITEESQVLPDSNFSPEMLLAQIAQGDKESEQELVSRYWRGLLFVLCRRTKDPDLAADLAQDTFLVVIDKARKDEIKNPAGFSGFIRQVGINLMIAHYRKEKRRSTDGYSDIDIRVPDDCPTLFQQLHTKNIFAIVTQILDELPVERDRQILKDHFIHEKDKCQICEELELSPQHFDRVLLRARARLKQLTSLKLGSESEDDVSSSLFNTLFLALLITACLFCVDRGEQFFGLVVGEFQYERHLALYESREETALIGQRNRNKRLSIGGP